MNCPAECDNGLQTNNEGIKITCPVCKGSGHVPEKVTEQDDGTHWIPEDPFPDESGMNLSEGQGSSL